MTDPKTPALPQPVAYRCTEIEPLLPPDYEPIVKFTTDRELAEMRARRAGEWATEPLYTATQLQEALDRADRAECRNIELEMTVEILNGERWEKHATAGDNVLMQTRAKLATAEAALEGARKVIEPFALLRDDLADDEMITMHVENLDDARQWLSANPEVNG